MKEFVQFGIRYDAGEAIELAFLRNFSRRLDESVHCDTRERAAHADPSYAERREIVHSITERTTVKKIDRFRRNRLDRCRDLFAGPDTR